MLRAHAPDALLTVQNQPGEVREIFIRQLFDAIEKIGIIGG